MMGIGLGYPNPWPNEVRELLFITYPDMMLNMGPLGGMGTQDGDLEYIRISPARKGPCKTWGIIDELVYC
jgi:hypothetical protein